MRFLAEIEINEEAFDEFDREQIKRMLSSCSIIIKKVDIPTYGTDNMVLRELCENYGLESWESIGLSLLYEKEIIPSARVVKSLDRSEITTLGELVNSTDERLREIPGFGRKSLEEVQKMLESLDLYLKES